jgi:hypothetical protein
MLRRRDSAGLLLLVILTTGSAVACRPKTTDAVDGASDAAAGDGGLTSDADATSPLVDSGSIPTDPAAAASQAAPSVPRPTPFTGTYRCFKGGLQLEQSGTIVTSTMHKDATIDTFLACTAIGDSCTGTVRDIHLVKTKSRKVTNVRPVTVVRTATGDVLVKIGPEQKTDPSAKPSGGRSTSTSKAAAGDQTFCPRR